MKRRGRRPARKARKPTMLVNRALHPIPQRFITKMKYATSVNSDIQGNYIFRLNSLFDPEISSGTNHQPYGFDTLAALYNRYRVLNTSWRINVASTAAAIQVGALPGNGLAAGSTSFSLLKESPRARYITQQPGGQVLTLSGNANIASIAGRSKAEYISDDRYQALVTGNPAEDIDLIVYVVSTLDAGIANVPINVIFEFTAEFFDMKPLGQS